MSAEKKTLVFFYVKSDRPLNKRAEFFCYSTTFRKMVSATELKTDIPDPKARL